MHKVFPETERMVNQHSKERSMFGVCRNRWLNVFLLIVAANSIFFIFMIMKLLYGGKYSLISLLRQVGYLIPLENNMSLLKEKAAICEMITLCRGLFYLSRV